MQIRKGKNKQFIQVRKILLGRTFHFVLWKYWKFSHRTFSRVSFSERSELFHNFLPQVFNIYDLLFLLLRVAYRKQIGFDS